MLFSTLSVGIKCFFRQILFDFQEMESCLCSGSSFAAIFFRRHISNISHGRSSQSCWCSQMLKSSDMKNEKKVWGNVQELAVDLTGQGWIWEYKYHFTFMPPISRIIKIISFDLQARPLGQCSHVLLGRGHLHHHTPAGNMYS